MQGCRAVRTGGHVANESDEDKRRANADDEPAQPSARGVAPLDPLVTATDDSADEDRPVTGVPAAEEGADLVAATQRKGVVDPATVGVVAKPVEGVAVADSSEEDERVDPQDDPFAESADDDNAEEDEYEDDVADGDLAVHPPAETPSERANRRRKKTGRKKRPPSTTAGQRLAAAKAAKAAKKAALRGKQADIVEDQATERAEAATRWLAANRTKLIAAVAVAALIALGIFTASTLRHSGDASAAAALWEAMEVANAEVIEPVAEGDEEETSEGSEDSDRPTFESNEARAEAALEAFNKVHAAHEGTRAAGFARIAAGNALRQLGRNDEAKEAFKGALAESDDDEITLRALEGIAFSDEANESWDQAVERYEEMRSVDRPGAELLADYHLARVAMLRDERETAKEKLRALLDALDEDDAPDMPFIRDQAELRLREIDPSLVQASAPTAFGGQPGMEGAFGAGGPGGEGGPSPEELQRMIQELMQKQQQQQQQQPAP